MCVRHRPAGRSNIVLVYSVNNVFRSSFLKFSSLNCFCTFYYLYVTLFFFIDALLFLVVGRKEGRRERRKEGRKEGGKDGR